MSTGTRDGIDPSIFRSMIKQIVFGLLPGRKSSHLGEALAAGYGYISYASQMADIKDEAGCTMLPASRMSAAAMAERLATISSTARAAEDLAVSTALRTLCLAMPGEIVQVGPRSKLHLSPFTDILRDDDDAFATIFAAAIASKVSQIELSKLDGVVKATATTGNLSSPFPPFDDIDVQRILVWLGSKDYKLDVDGKKFSIAFKHRHGVSTFQILQASTVRRGKQPHEKGLEALIDHAVRSDATEICIDYVTGAWMLTLCLDGLHKLIDWISEDLVHEFVAGIKERCGMDLAETGIIQSGGFSRQYGSRHIDFTATTNPNTRGEAIVLRIPNPEAAPKSLNETGMTRLDDWRRGFQARHGLCLVCGPTKSGLTTTLDHTVRELSNRTVFKASDLKEPTARTTADNDGNDAVRMDATGAIRQFLTRDVDVIVMGDIRDDETAMTAMKAAETGQLVLAHLHTTSVLSALTRLRDLGLEPRDLRHVLRAVVVQALVRMPCPACKDMRARKAWNDASACTVCSGLGHKGLTMASEVATFESPDQVDEAFAVIRDPRRPLPWKSMLDDGLDKAVVGKTTLNDLGRVFDLQAKVRARERGIVGI